MTTLKERMADVGGTIRDPEKSQGGRMQHKTLEAKVTTTDLGEFTAIAAAYSVDRVNERILPGAFKGSIERWQGSGKQIPLHWDHGGSPEDIIGTVDPASMTETEEGLEVKGKLDLDESGTAREAWRSMKKNRVGLSFGYMVTDEGEDKDGVRELKALDLFEVTITPAPANPDTRFIDMKSANPAKGWTIWKKWADEHIVEEPETKCCETCGQELSAEQAKAIDDARDDEPEEAKSEAQDPLRKAYDDLEHELTTRGIEVAEPPKVEAEPSEEPPSMEELRKHSYDLMLETLIGSEKT